MKDNVKVLDCKQSDHEYLHKDFHGALCYAIKYLDDNLGIEATDEYLKIVAETYFKPLSEKLKKTGLKALEDYFREMFQKENGRFRIFYTKEKLILEVEECPAIAHLKKQNLFFTERHCQSTVIVNEAICRQAGFKCSCEYKPGQGSCVQEFWKE